MKEYKYNKGDKILYRLTLYTVLDMQHINGKNFYQIGVKYMKNDKEVIEIIDDVLEDSLTAPNPIILHRLFKE